MADTELRFVIRADTRQGQQQVEQMTRSMEGMGKSAEMGGKKSATAFQSIRRAAPMAAAAFAVGTTAATAFAASAVKAAVDAEETASKFNTVFGAAAGSMDQWISDLKRTVPETTTNLRAMAANLQDLLVPIGIIPSKATEMNKSFVSLAADLASFNNIPMEEALQAIRSGLVGSSEPLQRFGVDARVAALETVALEAGLIKAGEEMTQTVRAEALLIQATKQSAFAMGDAARTMGSTANQIKFLQRDFQDIKEAIGTALIPVVQSMISIFTSLTANMNNGVSPGMILLARTAARIPQTIFIVMEVFNDFRAILFDTQITIGEWILSIHEMLGAWSPFSSVADRVQRDIDALTIASMNAKDSAEDWEVKLLLLNAGLNDLETKAQNAAPAVKDLNEEIEILAPNTEEAAKAFDKYQKELLKAAGANRDWVDAIHPATLASIDFGTSVEMNEQILRDEADIQNISTLVHWAGVEAMNAQAMATFEAQQATKRNAEEQERVNAVIERAQAANAKAAEDAARKSDQAWATAMGNIVSGTAEALVDAIFEAENFGEAMTNVFKETGKAMLEVLIAELFSPLRDLMSNFASALGQLFRGGGAGGFGNIFGGIFSGIGGGIGGVLGGGAGVAASSGAGAAAVGALGGLGGGAAAGGGGGFLSGLGSFFTNPITGIVAGAALGLFGLVRLFTQSPEEAAVKEAARDFGVNINESMVEGIQSSLGITSAVFEPMRKAILSAPSVMENFIIPAAEAQDRVVTLIDTFSKFQTAWGTFDLSEPLREAIESGNFEAYNRAWAEVFANSTPLAQAFGDYNTALAGTSTALKDVEESTIAVSTSNDEWQRKITMSVEPVAAATRSLVEYARSIGMVVTNFDKFEASAAKGFKGDPRTAASSLIDAMVGRRFELGEIGAKGDFNQILLDEFGSQLISTFKEFRRLGITQNAGVMSALRLALDMGHITLEQLGLTANTSTGFKGGIETFAPTREVLGLASGGIVRKPTLSVIGEAGPEAVIPLGSGMLGGIHLHMEGSQINGMDDFEEQVTQALSRSIRRGALSQLIETK